MTNIPEGATHSLDYSSCREYYKVSPDGSYEFWPVGGSGWHTPLSGELFPHRAEYTENPTSLKRYVHGVEVPEGANWYRLRCDGTPRFFYYDGMFYRGLDNRVRSLGTYTPEVMRRRGFIEIKDYSAQVQQAPETKKYLAKELF